MEMTMRSFKDLFSQILQIKEFVINLKGENLRNYKRVFYNQMFFNNANFNESMLDKMWEFIWDYLSYEEMEKIFKNQKII